MQYINHNHMRHFTLISIIFIAIFMQLTIASGQDVANYTVHTVIKGDNVFRISLRYKVPMDSIRQWNNLDQLYLITVGQELLVSGKNSKKAQNQVVDQVIAPKEIKDTVKIVENKLPEQKQEDAIKQKPAPIATVMADTTDLSALLIKARELAYNKGRAESRKLCKLILVHDSTYYDASVLMGRTYLWDDKYDSARFVLQKVINASPGYYDAMDALIDVELMSDNNESAFKTAELALSFHKDDNGFLYKKAKALNNGKNTKEALGILSQILVNEPTNENAKALKASIIEARKTRTLTFDTYAYTFSNDDPWYFGSVSIGEKISKFGSIIFRYNYAKRFGRVGYQYEIDAYPAIVKGIYLYFNTGFSNKVNFPYSRFTLEPYFKLPAAFELSLGFRYLNFDQERLVTFGSSKALIYTGTIGKYIGNYWLSLRPYFVPGVDGWSKSVNLTVRRYFVDEFNYLSLTVGTGMSPDEQQYAYDPFLYFLKSYKMSLEYQQKIGERFEVTIGTGFAREEISQGTNRDRFSFDIGGGFFF